MIVHVYWSDDRRGEFSFSERTMEWEFEQMASAIYGEQEYDEEGEPIHPEEDEVEITLCGEGWEEEIEDFDTLARLVKLDESMLEELIQYESVDSLLSMERNGYEIYESGADYAKQAVEDCCSLKDFPDWAWSHIDWEDVWDCELRHDSSYHELKDGRIVIFYS